MKFDIFMFCVIVAATCYGLTIGMDPAQPPRRATALAGTEVGHVSARAEVVSGCPTVELGDACMYNEHGELIGVHSRGGWIMRE